VENQFNFKVGDKIRYCNDIDQYGSENTNTILAIHNHSCELCDSPDEYWIKNYSHSGGLSRKVKHRITTPHAWLESGWTSLEALNRWYRLIERLEPQKLKSRLDLIEL
jgi:hypothetical protein